MEWRNNKTIGVEQPAMMSSIKKRPRHIRGRVKLLAGFPQD
jgi:hypothetical protein